MTFATSLWYGRLRAQSLGGTKHVAVQSVKTFETYDE